MKKVIDEICDALDVLKKYDCGSDFEKETGYHFFTCADKIIIDGLFDFAEAVGVKPEKDDRPPRVDDNGDISVKYFFIYRGYIFYNFVKVGNISEVVK